MMETLDWFVGGGGVGSILSSLSNEARVRTHVFV